MYANKRVFRFGIGILSGLFLISILVVPCLSAQKTTAKSKSVTSVKASVTQKKNSRKGVKSKIISIQKALNKQGFKLKVNGIAGPKTRAAIKSFQKQKGLKVTGKADKATLAKLGLVSVTQKKNSRKVAKPKIISIQKALNKQGFKLKVNGIAGPKTRAAIKSFQKQKGLKVTGKADKATLAKLGL